MQCSDRGLNLHNIAAFGVGGQPHEMHLYILSAGLESS
jgi:hypothetical protein